eukprot:5719101-Amphidinium_carterae.2
MQRFSKMWDPGRSLGSALGSSLGYIGSKSVQRERCDLVKLRRKGRGDAGNMLLKEYDYVLLACVACCNWLKWRWSLRSSAFRRRLTNTGVALQGVTQLDTPSDMLQKLAWRLEEFMEKITGVTHAGTPHMPDSAMRKEAHPCCNVSQCHMWCAAKSSLCFRFTCQSCPCLVREALGLLARRGSRGSKYTVLVVVENFTILFAFPVLCAIEGASARRPSSAPPSSRLLIAPTNPK